MTLKPFYSYCMCTLAHLFSLQCTFMIMYHHLKSHLNFFLINILPLFSILNHLPFIAKGLSSFLSFSPFIYKFTFSLSRSFIFSSLILHCALYFSLTYSLCSLLHLVFVWRRYLCLMLSCSNCPWHHHHFGIVVALHVLQIILVAITP